MFPSIDGNIISAKKLPVKQLKLEHWSIGVLEHWSIGKTISGHKRASETNNFTVLLVFWSAFSFAPKVTYKQYAPIGAP
jgi:hypothetical protein